jgi:hypothetical protein
MKYFPGYEKSHEDQMRTYFRSLPEDHRRRYAAVEAQMIGFGGVAYISQALGNNRQTIYTGMRELQEMGKKDPEQPPHPIRHIDALRRRTHAQRIPVLCVDTKKKEMLGFLHRPGQCYSTAAQHVYGHDFRHLASGMLVPHGVYDYFENVGFMTLGTSQETSAFVCDAIALVWEKEHSHRYPHATEILLTFDAGGANSIRSLRFKEDLLGLSKRLGLPLRVAHYPPYTSKWYPIEHRLFSQVERALHIPLPTTLPDTALGLDCEHKIRDSL